MEGSSFTDSAVGARDVEAMVLVAGIWLDENVWVSGRGRRGPAPATTERARWRRDVGRESSLGGGGGGSSLSKLAEDDGGRGLPDMRSGFFSRTFSNSLC